MGVRVSKTGTRRWLSRRFYAPIVPRPPTRNRPYRRNGTESVTMFGVMLRITITSAGFDGMSLDDMVVVVKARLFCSDKFG